MQAKSSVTTLTSAMSSSKSEMETLQVSVSREEKKFKMEEVRIAKAYAAKLELEYNAMWASVLAYAR